MATSRKEGEITFGRTCNGGRQPGNQISDAADHYHALKNPHCAIHAAYNHVDFHGWKVRLDLACNDQTVSHKQSRLAPNPGTLGPTPCACDEGAIQA